MASAHRVSLFEKRIELRLSSSAVNILFEHAHVLSEGQLEEDGYFGSSMITVDLDRAAELISDRRSTDNMSKLGQLLARDPRILKKAKLIAIREAQKNFKKRGLLSDVLVELHVRSTTSHLHIDIDLEAKAQTLQ